MVASELVELGDISIGFVTWKRHGYHSHDAQLPTAHSFSDITITTLSSKLGAGGRVWTEGGASGCHCFSLCLDEIGNVIVNLSF